jgi:hypothetical protein
MVQATDPITDLLKLARDEKDPSAKAIYKVGAAIVDVLHRWRVQSEPPKKTAAAARGGHDEV